RAVADAMANRAANIKRVMVTSARTDAGTSGEAKTLPEGGPAILNRPVSKLTARLTACTTAFLRKNPPPARTRPLQTRNPRVGPVGPAPAPSASRHRPDPRRVAGVGDCEPARRRRHGARVPHVRPRRGVEAA